MFNGKIHYKWPCSIAMLVYQRVSVSTGDHGKSMMILHRKLKRDFPATAIPKKTSRTSQYLRCSSRLLRPTCTGFCYQPIVGNLSWNVYLGNIIKEIPSISECFWSKNLEDHFESKLLRKWQKKNIHLNIHISKICINGIIHHLRRLTPGLPPVGSLAGPMAISIWRFPEIELPPNHPF